MASSYALVIQAKSTERAKGRIAGRSADENTSLPRGQSVSVSLQSAVDASRNHEGQQGWDNCSIASVFLL